MKFAALWPRNNCENIGVWKRACSVAFMKHVFPILTKPVWPGFLNINKIYISNRKRVKNYLSKKRPNKITNNFHSFISRVLHNSSKRKFIRICKKRGWFNPKNSKIVNIRYYAFIGPHFSSFSFCLKNKTGKIV